MAEINVKTYGIVDSVSNDLLQVAVIADEDYDVYVQNTLEEDEDIYECDNLSISWLNVERGCEYIPSLGIFQPKIPESETWTKNGDGVWNEIVNRPTHVLTVWDTDNDRWAILDDDGEYADVPPVS